MITVSRVINTPEKVSEKTRTKIQKLLEEEGYTHNTAAHNLASNKSGIICIYASRDMAYQDPFFQQFLVGVGSFLSQANYSIQIVSEIKPNQFCDGYILSGYNYADHVLEDAKRTGKPVVVFSSYRDSEVDSVDTDNVNSARKIVNYLISKGHRKIAVFLNSVKGTYVNDRFQGYRNALRENGIQFDPDLIHVVDNSVQGGMSAASWFNDTKCSATAAFFITDIIAVGFVMGIKEYGFQVPDDVSVVGFDGLGHHLMTTPKITTMVQPVYEISRVLSECLIDRIKNPKNPPVYRLVDGALDEEESVSNI